MHFIHNFWKIIFDMSGFHAYNHSIIKSNEYILLKQK